MQFRPPTVALPNGWKADVRLNFSYPYLFFISLQVSTSIVITHLPFTCNLSLSSSLSLTLFSSLCLSFFFSLQGPGSHRCCQNEWNGVRDGAMCCGILMSQCTRTHTMNQRGKLEHTFTHMHTTVCIIHLQISAKECSSPIQKTLHGCHLLTHPNYSIHILSLSLSLGQPVHYDTTWSQLLAQ